MVTCCVLPGLCCPGPSPAGLLHSLAPSLDLLAALSWFWLTVDTPSLSLLPLQDALWGFRGRPHIRLLFST